jgi:type I restriction enzyme S subunit
VPIPPLAEQQRIVAKIEELMPLVEEYGKAEERLTAMNAEFPDKLRKSILQQAIQGKLTERDPTEEPASELLNRIRAEKERLIKEGKIKKEKPLPPITEEEMPFEIPDGWEWVRLGDIADLCLGKMLDKTKNKGKLHPYLRNVNVRWGSFDFSDILQMRFEDDEEERYSVRFGDLVVCEGGEPGRCAVWADRQSSFRIQKALHRVRFYKGTNSFFAYRVFEFYAANGYFAERFTGATIKHLPGIVLANILFPLPPLAVQQRIVDRVNELLAVCDELK